MDNPADLATFGYSPPKAMVMVNGGYASRAVDPDTLDTDYVVLHLSFRHDDEITVGLPIEWAVKVGVSLLEAAALAEHAGLNPPG